MESACKTRNNPIPERHNAPKMDEILRSMAKCFPVFKAF